MGVEAEWTVKRGAELNTQDIYDILQLRAEVFVVEQDCPYQDLDYRDLSAEIVHIFAYVKGDDKVAAIIRIMYDGQDKTEAVIGRVVIRQKYRSAGLGRELMNRALAEINRLQPVYSRKTIMLHGQAHLRKWYESFGFEVEGDEFLEDGIPHYLLKKRISE